MFNKRSPLTGQTADIVLKRFKRITTRRDKLLQNFMGFEELGAIHPLSR